MAREDYNPISPYGYTPTSWVCLLFVGLFSASGVVHILQAWRYKYWIVFPTLVIGALLEIIGWAGRYWSSQNVLYDPPFLQQIITLIIAPVFFSAWLYTLLGIAIHRLGPQYSLLRPKLYIIVFVSCDIISLVLQAIGGGWAATAPNPTPKTPTDIMVGGIIFQLVSMIVFSFLTVDFALRTINKKPYGGREDRLEQLQSHPSSPYEVEQKAGHVVSSRSGEVKGWMNVLVGTGLCSLMIIIRGVYRSVELVQGWEGHLITHGR
ncbi:hypothetical protein I316_03233 [Kwoniella heveanensis BCC8398]|uniref:Uncharacterized protein n=1 Tax=Kwoniella heveanensis BCC8398 TaxID=1296120 RepID=A0A1B9GVZ5_9TREE|nr:hypothetical protein I316_03233 [Kwoniella heveanensis BCC8398]